jgi:hypothetical protein
MMRIFRPRVLAATDLPDEIADQARALAVALANPSTWDEFHREFWETYEAATPASDRRRA